MSSRSGGGPRISAWSRNPSTKERKAVPVGHTDAEHDAAVRAGERSRRPRPAARHRPPGLIGVDQELGDDLVVVAQPPRGRRAPPLLRPAGRRHPGLPRRPAPPSTRSSRKVRASPRPWSRAGQVPLAAADTTAATGRPAGPRPGSANRTRSALGHAREGGRHPFAARQARPAPGPRRDLAGSAVPPARPALGGAAQLPQRRGRWRPCPSPLRLTADGGQVQGGQLVGGQARVGQLVALAGDAVARDLVRMSGSSGSMTSGMPIWRSRSLSRSKLRRKASASSE